MKKRLKLIVLTLILLAGATVGAYFLLTRSGGTESEFESRRGTDQSDQIDSRAYRYDTDRLAVELKNEGEDKNVLNFDEVNTFTMSSAKEARDRIERVIKRTDASFKQPVIARDPFGTNPNSYYFYFLSDSKCMVKYTVTVENEEINDFTRYVYNGNPNNSTDVHEFAIMGLVPGMTNYIIMELVDESGSHREDITYKVDVPVTDMATRLNVTPGRGEELLENGLFFTFPKNDNKIYAYDNSGVLRNIISTESEHGSRIYQSVNQLLYQVSKTKIVRVSALGELTGVAEVSDADEIIDFVYDGYENVFSIVRKGKKYRIMGTSFDSGNTKMIHEFADGVVPGSITTPVRGNLYVSFDKPSGIMRFEAMTGARPKPDLLIGRKEDWKKTPYKNKIKKVKKKKEGEEGAEEKKDTTTVKDLDFSGSAFSLLEGGAKGEPDKICGVIKEKGREQAARLNIDPKKGTVDVEKNIPINGGMDSCCQYFGSHMIVYDLHRGSITEYDSRIKSAGDFSSMKEMDAIWKVSLEGMNFYG